MDTSSNKIIEQYISSPRGFIEISVESTQSSSDVVFFSRKPIEAAPSIIQNVRAIDVAAYILGKMGLCTSMKLHKLLYYCQAWSLVWDEAPLFNDRIEAWANGPVVKDLFPIHRGLFQVDANLFGTGNPKRLSRAQMDTIDSIIEFYGHKTAQWLINLTHSESPWKEARKGLDAMERGSKEITLESMYEYYSSL